MSLIEFITSALASGVAYDLMKAGTVLSGKHLKTYIRKVVLSDEEIDELAGVYNRILEENESVTKSEYAEILSKNEMINELCSKYAYRTLNVYNDSIVIDSSGAGAINVGGNYIVNNYLPSNEKK